MSLAFEYDQFWNEGNTPGVEVFFDLVANEKSISEEQVLSVVLVDQFHRWKIGQPLPLADYLQRFPRLETNPDLRLRLVLEEFANWRNSNRNAVVGDFINQHQQLLNRNELAILESMAGADDTRTFVNQSSQNAGTTFNPISIPGQLADQFKARSPDVELPDSIGRYQIKSLLGKGGFGSVVLAFDQQLDRQVAIKFPHKSLELDQQEIDLQLHEARTIAKLDHPNIIPVHDVGTSDGYPFYLVAKYVAGKDLAQRMRESKIEYEDVARIVAEIADALDYSHQKGIVHRDVKPSNILVGDDGHMYLVDFGLAVGAQGFAGALLFAGTPAYMSPEQASGEVHELDGRSDLFSLGVVLYEMLTGSRPFSANHPIELLRQIREDNIILPRKYDATIPEELEDICVKALLKRPGDRYQSCESFAEDLWEYVDRKTGVLPTIPHDQQPVTITKGRLSFDQELFTEVDPKGNVLRKYPLNSIEKVEVTPGINLAGPIMTGLTIIGAIAAFMLISSPVWSWTVTLVLLFVAFVFGLGWRMYNLKLVLTHGEDTMHMHMPIELVDRFVNSLRHQIEIAKSGKSDSGADAIDNQPAS